MSRNVEIVRDYLRGRYATADVCDPNGDYYPVPKFPESRPCHGPKEIARFFRDFEQAWDHVEITTGSIAPVGDDRVLACAIIAGEGRESGLRLESDLLLLLASARPDISRGRPPDAGGRPPRTRPPRENT